MIEMERAIMMRLEDCIAQIIAISENLIKRKALKIYEYLKNIGHSFSRVENHSLVGRMKDGLKN